MQRAVEGFRGLPHALEHVIDVDGVAFVNDSKATNIASARRSLESFAGGVVAIMGGRYKGGDFADLRDIVRSRAAGIVAIGEAAPLIEAALADCRPGSDGIDDVRSRRDGIRDGASPGHLWCWRPRARASTCSRTTPTGENSLGKRRQSLG
jgi:UDP-N-acetylmuramoylalanine-D-glutamate ligase